MPQKRKPPRLYLRSDAGRKVWIIRDGETNIRTGCSEDQASEAGRKLQEYLASKYEPERGGSAAEVTIGDVLNVYLDEKADDSSRPVETVARIKRLNEFFGEMTVGEIRGKVCREFADDRGTESGARRDLEVLRAAVNYYHGEYTLDVVPKITLPDKCLPRERWLTRQEVAAMIRAARNLKQCQHVVRLLLIGVYTGTRLGAMLGLQWMPNTSGGWVDLEKGILFRKAQGERVAHNKRKTPVKIPPRLLTLLRYWHEADKEIDKKAPCLNVINYYGAKVTKPHKAFRKVRGAAGLGEDVTPHILRHTRATWLANAGVDVQEAASSLGITTDEFERTYLHNDPQFQQKAANAY
jgi:integrase